jgi:hypothetical protein
MVAHRIEDDGHAGPRNVIKRAGFLIATAISVSAQLAQAPITGRIVADATGEPVQNARSPSAALRQER